MSIFFLTNSNANQKYNQSNINIILSKNKTKFIEKIKSTFLYLLSTFIYISASLTHLLQRIKVISVCLATPE